MATVIGTLAVNAMVNSSGITSGLNNIATAIHNTGRQSRSAMQGMVEVFGGIMLSKIVGSLAQIPEAFAGIVFGTNAFMERMSISFGVMLKNQELADGLLEALRDMAATTPFEMQGITAATTRLIAYGFAADEAIPMLQTIGDAAAASPTGMQESLDRITLALGQMRGAGRVNAQDMRQLTEVGIGAWDMLADALGVTQAKVRQMVTNREIDAFTGIEAILSGIRARFGGRIQFEGWIDPDLQAGLEDLFATGEITGRNLNDLAGIGIDAWGALSKATGKSIAETQLAVSRGFVTVDQFFDALAKSGEIPGLQFIGGMMTQTSRSWEGLVSTLKDNIKIFGAQIGKPFFDLAKEGLMKVVDMMKPDAFRGLIDGARMLADGMRGLIEWIKANWEAVQNFMKGMALVGGSVIAVRVLQTAFRVLWGIIARHPFVFLTTAIVAVLSRFVDWEETWRQIVGWVESGIDSLGGWEGIIDSIAEFLEPIVAGFEWVANLIEENWEFILNLALGLGLAIDRVVSFGSVWGAVLAAVGLVKFGVVGLFGLLAAHPLFAILTVVMTITSAFVDWLSVMRFVGVVWKGILPGLKEGINNLVEKIGEMAGAAYSWAVDFISENKELLVSLGLIGAGILAAVATVKILGIAFGVASAVLGFFRIQQVVGLGLWGAWVIAANAATIVMGVYSGILFVARVSVLAWNAALVVGRGIAMVFGLAMAGLGTIFLAGHGALLLARASVLAWNAALVVGRGIAMVFGLAMAGLGTIFLAGHGALLLARASVLAWNAVVIVAKGLAFVWAGAVQVLVGFLLAGNSLILAKSASVAIWNGIVLVANAVTWLWNAGLAALGAVMTAGAFMAGLATFVAIGAAVGAIVAVVWAAYKTIGALIDILLSVSLADGPIAHIGGLFSEWIQIIKQVVQVAQTDMPKAWELLQAGWTLAVNQVWDLFPHLWTLLKTGFAILWDVIATNFVTRFKQAAANLMTLGLLPRSTNLQYDLQLDQQNAAAELRFRELFQNFQVVPSLDTIAARAVLNDLQATLGLAITLPVTPTVPIDANAMTIALAGGNTNTNALTDAERAAIRREELARAQAMGLTGVIAEQRAAVDAEERIERIERQRRLAAELMAGFQAQAALEQDMAFAGVHPQQVQIDDQVESARERRRRQQREATLAALQEDIDRALADVGQRQFRIGMSQDDIRIAELVARGATDAMLAQLRFESSMTRTLEAAHRLRTPYEVLTTDLNEILARQDEMMANMPEEEFHFMFGDAIAAEIAAVVENAERALGSREIKMPGAVTEGSKEAVTAINRYWLDQETAREDPQVRVQRILEQLRRRAEEANMLNREIRDGVLAQRQNIGNF